MKYTITQIENGEDELELRYRTLTPEVEAAMLYMDKKGHRLTGRTDEGVVVFSPDEILYIEKVDDKTFVYTVDKVIRHDLSLTGLELLLDDISFFRCSKSMIVNIDKVASLKSLPSNRIDAIMDNGEHIIISRTYASEFRRILKGGLV